MSEHVLSANFRHICQLIALHMFLVAQKETLTSDTCINIEHT